MTDYSYSPDAPPSKFRRVTILLGDGRKKRFWAIPTRASEDAKLWGFYQVDDEGNHKDFVKKNEKGEEVFVIEKNLWLVPPAAVLKVEYAEVSLKYGTLEVVPERKPVPLDYLACLDPYHCGHGNFCKNCRLREL